MQRLRGSHATLGVSITDDIRVSDALAVVRAHRVHHLPVTRANKLVGILCSCDLHAARPDTSVNAIMRRPVVALDDNASLLDAVSTMNAHDIGCVVLMDERRACAVLTRADVLFAQPELAPLFVEGEPQTQRASMGASPAAGAGSSEHHDQLSQ